VYEQNRVTEAVVLVALVAFGALSGCGQESPPNPLPATRANVTFCREGNARMISDGLTGPMSSLRRHISQKLSADLAVAQVFFEDHFQNEDAFPELAPADVRLSLKGTPDSSVLADCRLILTEAHRA